ncbi:hypothetical protein Aperf_G00000126589 [Anoplocephala perfoliata]
MYVNCDKTKSAFSCLALTTSTSVTIMFWGFYFYDRGLLARKEDLDALPMWFIHATHSLVSVTALADILIAPPKPVPRLISLLSVIAFYLGYVLYTEYLITVKKIYAYPLFQMFSEVGRYQFYGIVFVCIFIVFSMFVLLIQFLSTETKQKPKNEIIKAKKNGEQNQLPQQTQNTKAKKEKQNKRD